MTIDHSRRGQILEILRQPPVDSTPSVEQLRAAFAAMMAQVPVPATSVEEVDLGGRRTLSVVPASASLGGVLLYFHGGGFVYGAPETALGLTAELAHRAGVRAYSVDYRLAPEAPFPAGLEDCLSAYRELLSNGVSAGEVIIAGDSAGGNLALTTCLAACEEGLPLPAGIITFSPCTDLTRSGESIETKAGIDPFFSRKDFERTNALYLSGHDPKDELASPLFAPTLAGFPPMLIQVGTAELLLDDATRLAAKAWRSEVDVILDVVAGVPHVFPSMTNMLPEATEALDRAALFITQRIGSSQEH